MRYKSIKRITLIGIFSGIPRCAHAFQVDKTHES